VLTSKWFFAASFCAIGVAFMTAGTAGTAAAAPPTKNSCPSGYELKSLRFVLSQATQGFEGAIRTADENRDRLLCYKPLPEPIPLFEPTFLYEDNAVP
jgi:hypothetical protein